MDGIRISLFELLKCISSAEDLVSPLLSNHHQQVAYLSYCLAKELNLSLDEQRDIFLAALVHDIGALSMNERLEVIEEEPITVNNHAFIGAKLFEGFEPMQNQAIIIKYHHFPWDYGKNSGKIPLASHILHLADRVCTRLKVEKNVLSQLTSILLYINALNGKVFAPEVVSALQKLVEKEYIWLDLISEFPVDKLDTSPFDTVELEIDGIVDLVSIFSHIIDFRSSFTARHSAGVAKTAEQLASIVGFSPTECKKMLIAGYLHDLGKLAVDNALLEKRGKLSEDEFNEVRSHTYFTYQLLNIIPQFTNIKEWAAYHHERIDGTGYPFHIDGENLSLGSRVMAVADVFCAITEDRPYRKGMNYEQATYVLKSMVQEGALDEKIVTILMDNYRVINELREVSQIEASACYENFLQPHVV